MTTNLFPLFREIEKKALESVTEISNSPELPKSASDTLNEATNVPVGVSSANTIEEGSLVENAGLNSLNSVIVISSDVKLENTPSVTNMNIS